MGENVPVSFWKLRGERGATQPARRSSGIAVSPRTI